MVRLACLSVLVLRLGAGCAGEFGPTSGFDHGFSDGDADGDGDGDGDVDADGDGDGDTDGDGDADTDGDGDPSVCERWNEDYATRAAWVWRPGPDECDVGEVSPEALEDAVRRTSLYRFLSGLDPIVENATFSAKAQECAVLMRALGRITHTPPAGSRCYTADAAEAAGSSNLAAGAGTMADAVDMYVGDEGVRSLGHRRWILFPSYAEGGFGIADWFSCQWVFGHGAGREPEFVAYPAEGEYPIEAVRGAWSVGVGGALFDRADVTVTRVTDDEPIPISEVWVPAPGYGQNTLAWRIGGFVDEGAYEVHVTGMDGPRSELRYTVDLVRCR